MSYKPQTITVNSNHSGVTRLIGFSIYEDAGAAAYVRLRKAGASGAILWHIKFAANESASIFFPKSVSSEGGVYVEEVSGSVTGVLFDDD